MPERLVVSFRAAASPKATVDAFEAGTAASSYLTRALRLKKQAEALGASLCAWSAQTFSFDFALDEIEEGLSLALASVEPEEGVAPEERFAVGIAQGRMDEVAEGGSLAQLRWGRPLLVAVALARIARPGEVLLDPDLPVLRAGELLTAGSRIAMDGVARVRGMALDVAQPWRRQAARGVVRVVEPAELIGRATSLEELAVPVGCLGVVRADAGVGGSRLLGELIRQANPSRALYITPIGAAREPLGAIRRALARSAALALPPTLPVRLRGALDRLLAGDGADMWAVAEIVDAWLAPEGGRFGLLAVDDACEINLTSLEVLATAINVRGAFRMIARLDEGSPLPAPLVSIPAGSSTRLATLQAQDAERLTGNFVDGEVSPDAVRRWARRGAGLPLTIREALLDALTSGELVWHGSTLTPRSRAAGRGAPMTARQCIERRMKFLSDGERAALTALALLGGDASDPMIDELSVAMAGLTARTALSEEALLQGGWVTRPEPGWLKLCSRTAVISIVAALPADAARDWHLAAAEMLVQHGGALGKADASWHARAGGDLVGAARLAIEAARATAAASLETATSALIAFAHLCDPAQAEAARRESIRMPKGASLPPPPPSTRGPLDGLEEGTPLPFSLREPPRDPFDTMLDESMFARFDPARGAPPSGSSPSALSQPRLPLASNTDPAGPPSMPEVTSTPPVITTGDGADAPPSPPRERALSPPPFNLFNSEPPPPASLDPSELCHQLAEQAKAALVQGDIATLERLVAQLRATGDYQELCERMSGFIALGRGAKSDALRRLREAAEAELPAAQKARALLAYGVALAAAGRTDGALLETLDALARAREASDRQGENACARFLARLSSSTGNSTAAAEWAAVASRSGGAAKPRDR